MTIRAVAWDVDDTSSTTRPRTGAGMGAHLVAEGLLARFYGSAEEALVRWREITDRQ